MSQLPPRPGYIRLEGRGPFVDLDDYEELRRVAALLEAQCESMKENAAIGEKWKFNSSLEEWFPITAQKLAKLREDVRNI